MKKLFISLSLALFTLALTVSCSGSKTSDGDKVTLEVEPELGDLAKYLSITDKDVTITLSEEKKKDEESKEEKDYKVVAASLAINVTKAVASNYTFGFDVEVLDENHIKISDLPSFKLDSDMDSENGDLDNILKAGNTRAQMESGVEASKWDEEKEQETWDKICEKGKYISIKPDWSDAKYAEYKDGGASQEEPVDESSNDVASGDFDDWLNSYEEFCNDYIDLINKAAQGDMDAMSEYPEMLKKAQELGEKMQQAQGDATPEQWAKYLEIQKKLMKAASNINE